MTTAAQSSHDFQLALCEEVARCYHDPLRFVRCMYPWGELGPLEHHPGPDAWQEEFLATLGSKVKANGFDGQHPVAWKLGAPATIRISSPSSPGPSIGTSSRDTTTRW